MSWPVLVKETSPRPALSDMPSGCEPSASVRGLSLDGSDPSLSLGLALFIKGFLFGTWLLIFVYMLPLTSM